MTINKSFSLWLAIGSVWSGLAAAEVVRIDVAERADVANAAAYGAAGAYEKIRGTLHFAVDRDSPVNAIVTDLALAEVNARAAVEFRADFYLLKPKDVARGNGAYSSKSRTAAAKASCR